VKTRSESPFAQMAWQKATMSGAGACVIVAPYDGGVAVSDSKSPDAPVLLYTEAEWDAFLDGARRGEFDDVIAR
jgi:hypothetical protein